MALAEEFTAQRAHLVAVAYRLTGSVSDAEDAVQESWLRLAGLSEEKRAGIRDLRGWLTTLVGRICLDRLRSATAQRERYVGQWLPEPIVTPLSGRSADDPLDVAVRDEGLRMAAMVVLDKLTPEQRVAFVLHDAFSVPFDEIADILGASTDAARQYASRGRRALKDAEPPPRASLAEQQELLDRFLRALLAGDVQGMTEVLHPDAVLIGDSNGKARTARQLVVGADKIARFFAGLVEMYTPELLGTGRPLLVNGDLGVFLGPAEAPGSRKALDAHLQTMAVRDGRIVAIYDVANPDKLTRVPAAEPGTPHPR
ncbi:sigma-70 family RNA polymerase sigma factor [Amycolatopsis acidiphila]|uniref:Sigma-70 family RNA polymerase sigma factor n=1 Tax=Amycolatopsis acidiphila TaxID=715473 RepID=A0A558A6A2_9PSEU|nr:sigma-70 family RNA polymerase sigma factor [Amycolatopsis acidiphila]TVT19776.1 sigma-70 family RNA polymerase sigma factor [Amycolatopsis acidiphila]UIJ61857.1 sigma-70 family RNA polymerase sigma factor [Amycolatopsis acidiphila]GHG57528.1 RNA polymerase sigma factor SigJ [Amycolatopsis acidiphila]